MTALATYSTRIEADLVAYEDGIFFAPEQADEEDFMYDPETAPEPEESAEDAEVQRDEDHGWRER
jgi:hypothetical protein